MTGDWIEKLTPQEAKEFMNSPGEVEEVGKDARGKTLYRRKRRITMRDYDRIMKKAALA